MQMMFWVGLWHSFTLPELWEHCPPEGLPALRSPGAGRRAARRLGATGREREGGREGGRQSASPNWQGPRWKRIRREVPSFSPWPSPAPFSRVSFPPLLCSLAGNPERTWVSRGFSPAGSALGEARLRGPCLPRSPPSPCRPFLPLGLRRRSLALHPGMRPVSWAHKAGSRAGRGRGGGRVCNSLCPPSPEQHFCVLLRVPGVLSSKSRISTNKAPQPGDKGASGKRW